MDNYLMHYGIKSQKWGVRRFQNSDGSLTAAGKKRYVDPNQSGYRIPRGSLVDGRGDGTLGSGRDPFEGRVKYSSGQKAKANAEKKRPAFGVDRYTKKAQTQINAHKNNIKTLSKSGHDYDDEEYYNSQDAKEKVASSKRAGKQIAESQSMIKYWDSAMKDISESKNVFEGRKKFKQYKKDARIYYPFG